MFLTSLLDPKEPTKAYMVSESNLFDILRFQFNPSSLTIDRSVDWDQDSHDRTRAYQSLAYGGSDADELTVELILDTSIPETPFWLAALGQMLMLVPGVPGSKVAVALLKALYGGPESVLEQIDKLVTWTYPTMKSSPGLSPMTPAGSLKRPPAVVFVWGNEVTFFGAIKDISFDLTLFDTDGTPVRAEGSVTLIGRRWSPKLMPIGEVNELFHETAEDKSTGDTSWAKRDYFLNG